MESLKHPSGSRADRVFSPAIGPPLYLSEICHGRKMPWVRSEARRRIFCVVANPEAATSIYA